MKLQKKIREKGESDYPFLVNMWIPKNSEINQETSRFCDAVQLTPFTDYFFTSAKCFDNLAHDMWLEDIGISWDEHVVSYSRHMSFLTRYKEEGGHFVILERFENNPLERHGRRKSYKSNHTTGKTVDDTVKPAEIEDMTKSVKPKPAPELPEPEGFPEKKRPGKSNQLQTSKPSNQTEDLDEEYEEIPADLAQYDDLEDNYEIKEQTIPKDDVDMKILRSLRNKRVRLSTPDIRGATECYVLGWSTYLKEYDEIKDLEGMPLRKEVVTKLPRKICKSSDPAHVCVMKDNEDRLCVEDLGSPLVCERKDARNNTIGVALVGIYTGFKNCVTTETGIFRSLSSELPWIARWARGTPITTSGFDRRPENAEQSHSTRSRRRRWRRRGRSGSGVDRVTANCILFINSFVWYIIISFYTK